MGLLKLSTPEIETYSEDLLKTLLIAKATIRVHPMTCTEIKSIIKSVEEHGAYIGKDISFAVEKYKYTSTDLASIRIHLEEKLSELKISIFPNKEYNLEKKLQINIKKIIALSNLHIVEIVISLKKIIGKYMTFICMTIFSIEVIQRTAVNLLHLTKT